MACAMVATMNDRNPEPPADNAKGGTEFGAVPFGFRDVTAVEKASLVGDVFAAVAPRYDVMNDLMSAGVHRLWKRHMVAALGRRAPEQILDLAGGTGDIGHLLRKRFADRPPVVTICDINPAMLSQGRERAWNTGRVAGLTWLCGNAESLPFADRSFDACTIAFGLRNLTDIAAGLAEIRRVLKPGGRFLCLEFTPSVAPALKPLYDLWSFRVIPTIGATVAGNSDAYRYLVESIRRFPPPDALAAMMAAQGFGGLRVTRHAGGIAALHAGWRI